MFLPFPLYTIKFITLPCHLANIRLRRQGSEQHWLFCLKSSDYGFTSVLIALAQPIKDALVYFCTLFLRLAERYGDEMPPSAPLHNGGSFGLLEHGVPISHSQSNRLKRCVRNFCISTSKSWQPLIALVLLRK